MKTTWLCFALFSEQYVYNRREAGISVAIASSVLVPFLICAGCFIVRLRQNASQKPRQPYLQQQQQPDFESDVKETEKDISGGQTQKTASRTHEGVYYTNEPLDMYTRN